MQKSLMRKTFCVYLFLSLWVQAYAEERYHLAKILVSGSHRYQTEDVVRATGLKENSVVTRQQLEASTKYLIDSGVFTSVEYHFRSASVGSGIEAQFQVKDAEKFLPAEFENFVWWNDQELESSLHRAVPLYVGKIGLAGTLADDLASALDKMVAAKGITSKVLWQQWAAPGELPSAYRFRLNGGLPAVKKVQLVGASHLAADVQARFVASIENHDYLRSQVKKNLERILVPAYLERGYAEFKPADIQPELEEDKTLTIRVSVSEGTQYKLAGYNWSGNTVASAEQLSKFITLRPGEPVNLTTLQNNLEAARKFLGKFGRESATISPVPKFSGDQVTYDFQITEGDVYRMGDLDIQGLDSAATQKIRDFWKLAPGSPYDNSYVPSFVSHLIMRRTGFSFSCEFLEQQDDAQKLVNVQLRFKAD